MANYWDEVLSPRPDSHGDCPYPVDSTGMLVPEADDHGVNPYPIDSSGDVLPDADEHEGYMPMHPGQPKPGSFK